MVNRIWQFRMGAGHRPDAERFRRDGRPAIESQLLDWLATEFVSGGWSVKAMDRLIVLSSAYQQSAAPSKAGMQSIRTTGCFGG